MIIRSSYLERLKNLKDKQIIKVLVGVRRAGKSVLLHEFRQQLLDEAVSAEQIQSYNFEDLTLSENNDYQSLYKRITDNLQEDKMNYIFLDEIQQLKNFEKVVDSLFIKENVDIYLTGSNAYFLSGELATYLTGRYIEIPVFPLSFKEFVKGRGDKDMLQAFQDYSVNGGFPFTLQLEDNNDRVDYLGGVVNTILVKDILTRLGRADATLVEELASYLTDISGSLVTPKKIADTLTSKGQKTSSDTVVKYLKAFQESFLFYKCDRYDIAGKRYLSINSKFYPIDQGLRQALLGNRRPNLGWRLEGIVYIELLRRGYEVYVGTLGKLEIDFVAVKNGVTEYYQVSQTVADENTYQREVDGLKQIDDNYRKILLTQDLGSYNDEGIEQINVMDWLLED
jgi:predicted AAA+ superfamily ATPase